MKNLDASRGLHPRRFISKKYNATRQDHTHESRKLANGKKF